MRLFAAVQPPARVLDHLENALDVVRGGDRRGGDRQGGDKRGGDKRGGDKRGGLRWTNPEDRHVTVAFFGEVPDGWSGDLAAALDEVAASRPAFEAALRGAGLFDGRTLWIGCAGAGWGPLLGAASRVGADLLGRAPDHRSRAHLTVARGPGGRGGPHLRGGPGARGSGRPSVGADPAALAHALALYTGPTWLVDELVLVTSRLGAGPGGAALHDVVHRSALAAVAG